MSQDDAPYKKLWRWLSQPIGRSLPPARKILRFLRHSVKKAQTDNLTQVSAALAFATLVSLIPLLAAISFLGERWFSTQPDRTVELLAQLLPYSETDLTRQLSAFLEQADTVRGVGFAIFVVAALTVFTNIEQSINRIWNVPRRRPFRGRLLSFTLLLFWGPVVIGATYSLLFYLRQQTAFERFNESVPAELIPLVVTTLGLTMLYWQVPYTAVRFRNALAGGLVAALLLEAMRQGFGLYVEQARTISVIYGSFGFVFFFMISIQLTWMLVLLGAEAAYCLQNFELVSHERLRAGPTEGSWIALAAVALITRRFLDGHPRTPNALLAEHLQLEANDLVEILTPVIRHGIIEETWGDTEGYLLSRDPHELHAQTVVDVFDPPHRSVLDSLPDPLPEHLATLRDNLENQRKDVIGDLTFARLATIASNEALGEAPDDASES